MKADIRQLLVYLMMNIIIFAPSALFAEPVTMNAVGEYVMGDNDTYTEAKKLALLDAKRVILEKVGTYIESETKVKNGQVSSDEVKQYSAGIVKVEEVSDERSVLANKASVVKVNVKAIVDPDIVIAQVLSFRNRKDIEGSSEKISAENAKLRKEIEQLNQQLKNVIDEKKYRQLNIQRQEALSRIDNNEKGLTLLLSGEGLYKSALMDRQKKDEDKERVKTFMKELASSYKLSASPLDVTENGDGTANISFEVKAVIQVRSNPRVAHAYITKINGVNLNEFLLTGLVVNSDTILNKEFIVSCRNDKCKETMQFMGRELNKLVIFVKVGGVEKEEHLSQYNSTFHKFTKKYNFKMPLSEVKQINQLKLVVRYDGQEYDYQGQTLSTKDQTQALEQNAEGSEKEELIKNSLLGLTILEKKQNAVVKFLLHYEVAYIIKNVDKGSVAERAGLIEEDTILNVDGKQIYSSLQMNDAILNGIQKGYFKMGIGRGIKGFTVVINMDGNNENTVNRKPKKVKKYE